MTGIIRAARSRWEYWNSSTQRQVRYLAGFREVAILLAAYVAVMAGIWLGFIDSLHR